MRVQLWWCDRCSLPLSCLSGSVLIVLKLRENITGHFLIREWSLDPFLGAINRREISGMHHICASEYINVFVVFVCVDSYHCVALQMPVLIETNIICCAVSESFCLGFLGPCGGLFLSQSPHFIWDSSLHILVFGSHLLSSEEWGTESHRVALSSSPPPSLQIVNLQLNVCLPFFTGLPKLFGRTNQLVYKYAATSMLE